MEEVIFMDTFKFTRYNEFESNGLINCIVSFVPAVTIECNPPYVRGVKTSTWIKFRPDHVPSSQEELETCLGMSILSWE